MWENWTKFNGEQTNPGDSTDFEIPFISASGTPQGEGLLGDYMGIPPGLDFEQVHVNALPFRCYASIYNFWFRDENLVDSRDINLGDGPDTSSNSGLRPSSTPPRRRKRRDYLTSALPWPQKGPDVTIDLGGNAPITTDAANNDALSVISTSDALAHHMNIDDTADTSLTLDPSTVAASPLYADLQAATGFTINDLRESFQIQKLLERDARGGTRYPEILRAHFQVSDPGLLVHQRPLFLGGGSSHININPVQQTTQGFDTNNVGTPQGNLAAYGTVSASGHGFTASFTEHGHIIGIVNVRADLTYQQGLERYWSRLTRFDFYWPALSHLGEQTVHNSELYVSNDKLIDDEAFGYMPRYDEYRFKQSQISGLFRSAATASLDVWHLAQDFSALPVLDKAFIEDTPPIDRVVATQDEPHMLLDVFFKIKAARPLPLYGTPGLMDHF